MYTSSLNFADNFLSETWSTCRR